MNDIYKTILIYIELSSIDIPLQFQFLKCFAKVVIILVVGGKLPLPTVEYLVVQVVSDNGEGWHTGIYSNILYKALFSLSIP